MGLVFYASLRSHLFDDLHQLGLLLFRFEGNSCQNDAGSERFVGYHLSIRKHNESEYFGFSLKMIDV